MKSIMRRAHINIYNSRKHLAVTLLLVVLPFLFLLGFSRYAHIAAGQLFSDVGMSFVRLVVAYLISVVLAWILAILFYKGRRAKVALPVFDVLQSFPAFAMLPLATLVFGRSNTTVIFFLVITIIWPILFSILSSLKLIKHEWEEAVEISGMGGVDYLKYFLWPVSVPGLITGSIIGLGEGWEALVATEIIVRMHGGLGDFFNRYSTNAEITALGIAGLLILIFSMNKLFWLPLLESSHRRMEE
ncbi:MAG: hypothetical protein A3C84_04925 [Candidatus Ryanbacteria bacterium RIFCSPHIGHO2_02_FULL_48_12]|uniref:ABC transmembrane type-1 domain-containing protein n=1 Tax=Candidatus Ryanbacteria bacterium RIFCSPHIGHO2_01_FULL_48_27 TaxID=1802115 RepID=A0A1G2G867_9BACT|nr:MAG: hypothetical protein A2756_06200 [Candidatus Ryanbacteria bacterium RIFCSPHIGHO2_01_FULL_48_27]OGZ49512.1 MAG: hypothetical protein A3C84_04925 [Candidatus Ryanbacteria bacterium RIFCSPHIGHO2_02_FULL_48_12]